MGAPSVSYSAAPLRVGTALLPLACSPVVAGAARTLLLHVAEVVLLRLLLQLDLVSPIGLWVAVRVQVRVRWPRVSLTVPRRFCAPCDNPSVGDWRPTFLFLDS